MINLAEIVTDPDLAQSFVISRYPAGSFTEGAWSGGAPADQAPVLGVVTPSKTNDIVQFLPEGERQSASITVYSAVQLVMSDGKGTQSDLIKWQGDTYRVAYSKPWQTFGYWFAMAVKQ